MATRMNPLAGRYFNDPAFAAGISNLAAAFAPPGAEDYLTAARVQGQQTQNTALSQLLAAANGNLDVLGGVAAGGWVPTQGFEKMRGDLANDRYATDMTAETSRANNTADNERAMREAVLRGAFDHVGTKLGFGEALPGIDPELAAAMGVTAGVPVPTIAPQTGAALGAPADPLSSDEVTAAVMQDYLKQHPEMQPTFATNGLDTVNTVDPATGKPRVSFSADAAASGAEPFVNPGATAAADLVGYMTADGREGSAVFNPTTGALTDAATGEALPPGTKTFKIVGSDRAAASGATTANTSEWNQQLMDANFGLQRAAEFEKLLAGNPGVLGVAGTVQGLAQSAVQGITDIAGLFGSDTVIRNASELQAMIQQAGRVRGWNSAVMQARAMALEMAYYDIKSQDPGGEVNVRELERVLGQYMGGFAGNQPVLDVLKVTKDRLALRARMAQDALDRNGPGRAEVPASGPAPQLGTLPPAQPARPRATNPQTGEVVEWDGQAWVPVQ